MATRTTEYGAANEWRGGSGIPLENMVTGWHQLGQARNEQTVADIEALEEALCQFSNQLVRVEVIARHPAMQGRQMDYAVQFLETGLVWLETAIGGAKERLLPDETG